MLNQCDNDRRKIGPLSEWCVGEPPARWDVGLGARIAEAIRRVFWRERGLPVQPVALVAERTPMRKAA